MENYKKTCYLASGWFCSTTLEQVKNLEKIIEDCGYKVFSPRKETLCLPNATKEQRNKAFNDNLKGILNCDLILANTSNGIKGKPDPGTLFEAGFACGIKKPIIYFCGDLQPGMQFNLMLAESAEAVCTNYQEVILALEGNKMNLWNGEIE